MSRVAQGTWMILAFLMMAAPFSGVDAQPLVLQPGDSLKEAATFSRCLKLDTNTPAQQALQRLDAGDGDFLKSDYPSLGFFSDSLWCLLSVQNQSAESRWLLRTARPIVDYLDVFVLDEARETRVHFRGGDRRPFSIRQFAHPEMIFEIDIPQGGERQLLIRVQGENVIDLPVTLYTMEALHATDSRRQFAHGLYYGAIAIICLYNLLIFFSIRDVTYLYYVGYLGTFGLYLFTQDGLSAQHLWPQSSLWSHLSVPVLAMVVIGLSILFVRSFLQLDRYRPRLSRVLLLISASVFLAVPLVSVNAQLWAITINGGSFIWIVAVIVLASMQLMSGFISAKYLLIAFLAIGCSVILYVLKNYQWIPNFWLYEYIMQMGTAAEALLLSFALAHRMTVLKSENERIQKEANEALEQRVQERTRELNEALNVRSEFLAVMSHEIRTPLNGIIGTIDMLRDTHLDEQQRRQLHIIEHSGQSLLQLIDDVLDYARIEAGKMPIEQVAFNLRDELRESLDLFEQRARVNNVTTHLVFDSDAVGHDVLGDPVRTRQVLANLVSNAIKFTENGTVTLSVNRDEDNADYCNFAVEDTGIGIPAEKMPRLFEHFYQLDSSTSRRYGGAGLGLAITRQLVELMGGEIGVESDIGRGSRFWFRLPLPRYEHEMPSEETLITDIPPLRILIVDDNHINLMVAQGLCKKLGHDIEIAESGLEAIALMMTAERRFDVILMDCEMPDMDGFETSRRIILLMRERGLVPSPIVALTAHAVPDKIAACKDSGMSSHIAKPVTLAKLHAELLEIYRNMSSAAS